MKKIMLLACGIFIALTQAAVFAKIDESSGHDLNDTLVIRLKGDDQIFVIGKELKLMVEYQQADSIKQLFLNDYRKALEEHVVSRDMQTIHYFVHPSGKRRIKAETAE